MDKKGLSIVEIIAVVAIMGIVAGIGSVSAIAIVNRQRKNATISSLNEIYKQAKSILYQAQMESGIEAVTVVSDEFCYATLTDMIDSKLIDGEKYRSTDNEIYFCYYGEETWVVIGATPTTSKPTSTNNATVNNILVTFDFNKDTFKRA